ncbi:hypothetical protein [Acuticoccus sediminis]|uniref:hypothetical protein n=1 Tax=Acuticoccus sediminis TaxID=2184697 RepID=UPI001CFE2EB2|nr:hypothetical protein [Acuticoccus sediminis]
MNAPFPIGDTHRDTVDQLYEDARLQGMTQREALEVVAHLELESAGRGLGMAARTTEELHHTIEVAKMRIEEAAKTTFYDPPGFRETRPREVT